MNRIFDPDAVVYFYHADQSSKTSALRHHSNTNYSVVDLELIQELYARHYEEQVAGVERLRFFNMTRVISIDERDREGFVTVHLERNGEVQ